LAGCSPQAPSFKSTDITGAAFAQDLNMLTDHTGRARTIADFRGKAMVYEDGNDRELARQEIP
jgi:protein SCO1/2